ncbi:hypothetical protein DPMN_009061 [Dreissena polymorpha]|uniref:Uncharacterized protein n=1 Tax=Dreissena polymorpha TaxID=45954 RepID=A0A9D4RZT2_DREPO|nr:hypothetical protein DPMN_009061 [Dreissena polymorpha]
MLERLKTIEAEMNTVKKQNLEWKRDYEATKSIEPERRHNRYANRGRNCRGGYSRGRYSNRVHIQYNNPEYVSTTENKQSHLNERALSRQGTLEAKQK